MYSERPSGHRTEPRQQDPRALKHVCVRHLSEHRRFYSYSSRIECHMENSEQVSYKEAGYHHLAPLRLDAERRTLIIVSTTLEFLPGFGVRIGIPGLFFNNEGFRHQSLYPAW